MGFIKANGINLHYEIYGSGPKLLFIHGIGADLTNPIGALESPLPQHFTVLAFDPRDLGQSERTSHDITIADMADDAAGLAAALGWEKYHVFGASMGGMVAQELALHYPERVDKMVWAVTNAGGDNGAPLIIDKLDQLSTIEKLKISDTRQDEAWAAAHPEIVAAAEQQAAAAKAAMQANPDIVRGFQKQVNAVLKHDAYERLGAIKAETLVFNGRYDGSNPPDVSAKMAARIPHARFELVDHGHATWFYDSSIWEMVIDFLRT